MFTLAAYAHRSFEVAGGIKFHRGQEIPVHIEMISSVLWNLALGKWLVLQKCFQLGSWLFLVPLQRCKYSSVDLSEQSFLFVRTKQSPSLMRMQMTECIEIQLFCSRKCSVDVPPRHKKIKVQLQMTIQHQVWQLPPTPWLAHCVSGCMHVCFHDTSFLIYTMWRRLMYCRPPRRTGRQPRRRVTITPTTFPHVCEAGGLWAAFLLSTQSSLIKSHHWICSSVFALWLQFTQNGDDGGAISLNAHLCHSSHELWIIRKPPVVCSSSPHKDVGQKSCSLWRLYGL